MALSAMLNFFCCALVSRAAATIDIIGYYGNSGNALSSIPTLDQVHPGYNVLILTFASVDSTGEITLEIQGPYEKDHAQLAADVLAWKQAPDQYGRTKHALFSIGGQNGRWPGVSAEAFEAGCKTFMAGLNLDGLDIDLEGSDVSAATGLAPAIQGLTSQGFVVTAAPEAAQISLDAYKEILPLLTWVHPQFYNNGPNAVAAPYVPSASLWPTPWTVTDWQAESGGQAFWAGVLAALGEADGLSSSQLGMLVPATSAAAGSYNNWDVAKLAQQVKEAGVRHIGTWAIAYDNTQSWKLAEALLGVERGIVV